MFSMRPTLYRLSQGSIIRVGATIISLHSGSFYILNQSRQIQQIAEEMTLEYEKKICETQESVLEIPRGVFDAYR